MNKKFLILLTPIILFCGCAMIMGGGQMTQIVLRDGSSEIKMVYPDIASSMGGMNFFNSSLIENELIVLFSTPRSEQEWNTLIEGMSSSLGIEFDDPRLKYPGPDPSDEEIRNISEAITDFSDVFYERMIDQACDQLTSGIDQELENSTCELVGDDLILKGLFIPKNASLYFYKEVSFPFINYKYNPLGIVELFESSVPGLSEMMDQFKSFLSPEIFQNLTQYNGEEVPEEVKQNISSQMTGMLSSFSSISGKSFSHIIKMPGTITNSTIGSLSGNSVKIDLISLYTNPEVGIITSQELNPITYVLGAVGVLAGAGVGYGVIKRKGRKRVSRKKSKTKKRRSVRKRKK